MRASEIPLLADRLSAASRWLALFVIALLIANQTGPILAAQVVLILAGLWSFALSLLAVFQRRMPFHPLAAISGDILFANLLFELSGSVNGPLIWVGIYPLITAVLYLGIPGGLALFIINFISLGLLGSYDSSVGESLRTLSIPLLLSLVVGLVLGSLSQRLDQQIKQRYSLGVSQRQEIRGKERQRAQALYNISTKLNTTLNYQRVLDLALDLSSEALAEPGDGTASLVSAFYLFRDEEFHVGSSRRYTGADTRVSLRGEEGLIARAIEAGAPRFMEQPSEDPETNRIVALHKCKSAYCYPLKSGLDVYGLLLFGHQDAEYFNEERCEILEAIGSQAQVALQNARLYKELEDEKQRFIKVQEEAQQKLARNLHDGPTQSVAAIAMRVNFARRLIERDVKATGDELYKIEDLARRTTKEIRHMLFTLRPLVLESSGLIPALESMAQKMGETYGQEVIIEADPEITEFLEINKQGIIFYVAEEAVNNARKHAEAEHIWVRLRSAGEELVLLEVEDDGIGFDVDDIRSTYSEGDSLGLLNMRERAELINGILKIDSEPGKGTRVSAWLPLSEEAAERLRHGQ